MKTILLSGALLLLCGLGLQNVSQQFQKNLTLQAAHESATEILSSTSQRLQFSTDERVGFVVDQWRSAVDKFPESPQALSGLARAHLAASAREVQFPKRIEHLCTTYTNLTKAAAQSPQSARLQISLADIKTQLRNPAQACPGAYSANKAANLKAEEHLKTALTLEPYNTSTLYLAAVVYRALDKKEESLKLLKKVQEISSMTSAQRSYTYNMVESQKELEVGMPRKYPEVISWYSHFERERPHQLQQWNETFVSAFQDALSELKVRLRSGSISSDEYARFVVHLSRQTAISTSDTLRKDIDEILSVVYQLAGKHDWSNVLAQRSAMNRIPIAKSFVTNDKTPRSTMLHHWISDDQHLVRSLDARGGSLGLFVPPNRSLRMLVIESGQGAPRIAPESLELFASEDNREFIPLSGAYTARAFSIEGVQHIVYTFDRAPFRYLKIVSNASGEDCLTPHSPAYSRRLSSYESD